MTTATLLTVAQMREHLETDLTDAALQRLLDAEESEIIARYGSHATATETLPGGGTDVILARTPSTITSLTETLGGGTPPLLLVTDDYRLWPEGRLERLTTGTNARSSWAPVVTAVYVPEDATAQRRGVLIHLVMLAARYSGLRSESVGSGDYSMTTADYTAEREALLRSLAGRQLWVV
jgi:hypothetical protein